MTPSLVALPASSLSTSMPTLLVPVAEDEVPTLIVP